MMGAVSVRGEQVYQGRHLHRDVAVKVLQLDGDLVRAVQREVRRQLHSHCCKRRSMKRLCL